MERLLKLTILTLGLAILATCPLATYGIDWTEKDMRPRGIDLAHSVDWTDRNMRPQPIDLATARRLSRTNDPNRPLEEDPSDSGLGRIIGGDPTGDCTMTSYVLMIIWVDGVAYICGGNLISDEYILTAAHCTDWHTLGGSPNSNITFQVTAGSVRCLPPYNDEHAQTRQAVLVDRHYNWNPEVDLSYDFALLRVTVRFVLGNCVKAIPLACPDQNPFGNACLLTAGCGRNSTNSSTIPAVLQRICIPFVEWNECEKAWDYFSYLDSNSNICAGNGRVGNCNGDSGGPLYYVGRLVGLVSWGAVGCQGYPTVYAKVSAACLWISCVTGGDVRCDCPEYCRLTCREACKRIDMTDEYCPGSCPGITTTTETPTTTTNYTTATTSATTSSTTKPTPTPSTTTNTTSRSD